MKTRHHQPGGMAIAALVICVSLSSERVRAADFEGACCADLEERVAELEATVAGKGNRRISLTVSGQINQAVLFWDDGGEKNAYQVTNSHSGDRLRFDGSANITSSLRAGYYLEFGTFGDTSGRADQFDAGGAPEFTLRQSLWYLDSNRLGALSIGLAAPATDDIIAYNFGNTSVVASANAVLFGGNFFTRDTEAHALNSLSSGNTISLRWRRFMAELDTPRANLVRYDTPVLHGFTASASWGEDDYWDVALRYTKQLQDVRFAFGIGYYENHSEDSDTLGWPSGGDTEDNGRNTEIKEVKGSASLIHEPSGLYLSGAYVHRDFSGSDLGVLTFACFPSGDAVDIMAQGIACTNRPDYEYWWLSGGIRRKFFALGMTSIYGEYGHSKDAVTGLNVSVRSAVGGDIDYVTSSTMDLWGAGIVQTVNAANMDFYLAWRHYQADVSGLESGGGTVVAPIDDADLFLAGARIRF